jgi:cyclohexa-1,5-dienecarbonyl-CoA hydratase
MADQDTDPHEYDVFAPSRERSYQFVQFETKEGISHIVLNRPPANVLSFEVMEEVNLALESLEYQKDTKLVVLSGRGKYFSAGFELTDHLGDRGYLMLEGFRRIFENLARLDKPTLAVVAGPALGAGSILASACDIVLAGASARFGHPEIKGGVFNTVAVALLPHLVGRKKAFELTLFGGGLTAAEAERVGLVTRVVPDERLEAEAAVVVQRFQESSAVVLQLTRRALAGGLDLLFPDALRHAEDVYLNQLMATEDAEEGLRAIMAKRKPQWKDR